MITILTYAGVAALGAITGIFIYRNNTKLIDKKARKVDAVWKELDLTDKFDDLGDKIEDKIEDMKKGD
jgi:hypothetical protein